MTNDQRHISGPDALQPSAGPSIPAAGQSVSAVSRVSRSLLAAARMETLLVILLVIVSGGHPPLALLPHLVQLRLLCPGRDGDLDHGPGYGPIIITGEIDLSVESMVGLGSCILVGCGPRAFPSKSLSRSCS